MGKSKRAVEDGKQVRKRAGGRFVMTPDEVVAVIRKHIRQTMGDWMENNATVFSRSGYFYVRLPYRTAINRVGDDAWRAMFREGVNLRRYSIGLALRAMHGEELT